MCNLTYSFHLVMCADYHPGEYVQHGDHMHYVPGHYDYHDPRYTNGGE